MDLHNYLFQNVLAIALALVKLLRRNAPLALAMEILALALVRTLALDLALALVDALGRTCGIRSEFLNGKPTKPPPPPPQWIDNKTQLHAQTK
jgi:hypothetical protein